MQESHSVLIIRLRKKDRLHPYKLPVAQKTQEKPHYIQQRRPQVKFGLDGWCNVISSTIDTYILDSTLIGNH
ncbi:hypothetical protein Trydic_g2239 [Trypoxylus dichotomus]